MIDRSHPFIEVAVDGRTVSDAFYQRLISATINDEQGQEADTCELVFDDAGNEIEVPEKGAKITVKFGFKGAASFKMGVFTFERASIDGGQQGETLTISCKSADMRSDVKEPLSEHFDDTTIGDVVETLAKRHGFKAKISDDLKSQKLGYIARTEQSSVDFLTRLADRSNALFAIKDSTFLFMTRGSLPPITIARNQCINWQFAVEPRPKFGKVQAGWFDRATGKTAYEDHETGLEGTTNRLRKIFTSQSEAKKAAESEGERQNRATGSGTLTLSGMPELMADAPITTTGFRNEGNGNWRAASVTHTFSDSYTTSITLEAPKEGKQ